MTEPYYAAVVEDEALIAEHVARWLRSAGWYVVTCHTLADAKRVLERQRIDLIILDLQLPDGRGTELLQVVGPMDVPPDVVILTGFGTYEDALTAIRANVLDFLAKPITQEEFEAMLRRVQIKQRLRLGVFAKHLARVNDAIDTILKRLDLIEQRVAAIEGADAASAT